MFTIAATLFTSTAVADGLPGEYFITQRWRDLLSSNSPATNPAFMTEANYTTIRGAFSPSLSNSFVLYETGAVIPLGLYQAAGVSVLGVTANDPIIESEWDPVTESIKATGKEFKDSHFRIMLSYAVNPWNKLSVGGNLNVYYDPNFGEAIVGFALDLGVSYRLAHHPILGEHLVGMSFQNIISPDFSFEELQQQSINAKISWVGRMWERRIEAGIDMDFKDFTAQAANFLVPEEQEDGSILLVPGDKSLEFDFNFRVGFWLMKMINVYGHVGDDYWGLSGGMNVPTIFGGRDFQAAYQYTSVYDDALAFQHTVYFRGEFGASREEVYAKKMAKEAVVGPGKLYNTARELLARGEYWKAFFVFGKISTEYPDFFKNDWVRYYMGECQEHMDMRELANETYNKTISEFAMSPAVFTARLGLMRVNYRDANYYGVESEYNTLAVSSASDSIKNAAAYIMGSARFASGNYVEAISYFSKVPATHSDYPFAQHSMAIAYAMNDNYDNTLTHLDNAINYIPVAGEQKTDEQNEIINRSYVLLGLLYYEGLSAGGISLSSSVAALQEVPSNSYYYSDALLGRAWVALKATNWGDVRSTAEELKTKTNDVEVQSEADLMIAYSYMVDNTPESWQKAADILTKAVSTMKSYQAPSSASLTAKEDQYYTDRGAYYDIAQAANEFANVRQGSYVLGQIDSLKTISENLEESVRSFAKYQDEHNRSLFFSTGAAKILDELEYALPKAIEGVGKNTSGAAVEAAEAHGEVEDLQEKLRRLQEEAAEAARREAAGN